MTLLQSLPRISEYVFASRGGTINEKALNIALNALTANGYTVHGFRSTFRDWAGDATTFDSETVEHALAHEVGSKVAQAYRRGSGLEKRKLLMQAWADHCDGAAEADNVVKLHA